MLEASLGYIAGFLSQIKSQINKQICHSVCDCITLFLSSPLCSGFEWCTSLGHQTPMTSLAIRTFQLHDCVRRSLARCHWWYCHMYSRPPYVRVFEQLENWGEFSISCLWRKTPHLSTCWVWLKFPCSGTETWKGLSSLRGQVNARSRGSYRQGRWMLRANVASYTLNPLSSGQTSASESSSLLISTHCQCPPGLEGVPSNSASLPRCLWTWQAGEVEKYWLVNTTPFRGCLLLVNIPPFTGDSEPIIKVVVCAGLRLE